MSRPALNPAEILALAAASLEDIPAAEVRSLTRRLEEKKELVDSVVVEGALEESRQELPFEGEEER